ncbi:unnamed protein product [Leuciscus chuanchicus]
MGFHPESERDAQKPISGPNGISEPRNLARASPCVGIQFPAPFTAARDQISASLNLYPGECAFFQSNLSIDSIPGPPKSLVQYYGIPGDMSRRAIITDAPEEGEEKANGVTCQEFEARGYKSGRASIGSSQGLNLFVDSPTIAATKSVLIDFYSYPCTSSSSPNKPNSKPSIRYGPNKRCAQGNGTSIIKQLHRSWVSLRESDVPPRHTCTHTHTLTVRVA